MTFSITASRSVPGTMNDYAIYIESAFHHEVGVARHTLRSSMKRADTPVWSLGYDRPRDVVRRQLSTSLRP